MPEKHSGYTGYSRAHTTRLSVRLADKFAGKLIAIGGIGTIISVSLVCLVLLWKVLPLFSAPEAEHKPAVAIESAPDEPVMAVDEYQTTGWLFSPTGQLRVFRLDNGQTLHEDDLAEGRTLTAWSFSIDRSKVALAFDDGTVRIGQIKFTAQLAAEGTLPEKFDNLQLNTGRATFENKVVMKTASGLRVHDVQLELSDPVQVSETEKLVRIDRAQRASGPIVSILTSSGKVFVRAIREIENLMTGEIRLVLSGGDFQIDAGGEEGLPQWMMMAGAGDTVYLVWKNGQLERYDIRDMDAPELVERVDLVETSGREVSQIAFLLGRATLLVGDSSGEVNAWFRRRYKDQAEKKQFPADGWKLISAHHFPGPDSPVTSISSSQRTRIAVIGHASGHVRLLQVTSEDELIDLTAQEGKEVLTAVLAPKEDAVYALTEGKLDRWTIDLKYPEANFKALFLPVWYEGAPEPKHVWQSSSGDDSFEPKFGMMPLIFGTIKATAYSLLFGVPLAMLAAVYTSEFLTPKLKSRIKPTVEMMASLPSVVLGFLAALVLAPLIEDIVPHVLTSIYAVPFVLLLGAYLWQLVPGRISRTLSALRLPLMLLCIGLGASLAWVAGPLIEDLLFAGDIKLWLDGQIGTGTSGWLLLTIPAAGVGVLVLMTMVVNPWLRGFCGGLATPLVGLIELGKFLLAVVVTLFVAWMFSLLLNTPPLGWDPRGGSSFLGTYDQRNALIVGFIMGFAIIPIIYTIAEDALSTVPDHLRAASLGAGATPWQTATRIIIPTAMSGLFSAVMIGLGRAVGETMIVLMAAGNIPVLEWNIFNGMRTLSANIAVELPEAPKDELHFRTLFLAALVLFAMTFVINTAAELIRLRFRKKAYQL
ncbi:MAG: ABC transporter permease subunit [Phycisphaerae bacterium]